MGNRAAMGCALAVLMTLLGAPAAAVAATPADRSSDPLLPPIQISIPPLIDIVLFAEDEPEPVATPDAPEPTPSATPTPTAEPTPDPVAPPPVSASAPPPVGAAPSVAPAPSGSAGPELPTEAVPEPEAVVEDAPTVLQSTQTEDAPTGPIGRTPNGGSGREDLAAAASHPDGLERVLPPALAVSSGALASLVGGVFVLRRRIAHASDGHGRHRTAPGGIDPSAP